MSVQAVDKRAVSELWSNLYQPMSKAATLDEAAQAFTNAFHTAQPKTVKLARLFTTIPFAELPDRNKQFAQGVAGKLGAAGAISHDTPILSLMGTSGALPLWNQRESSAGHLAIPLVSERVVAMVPMLNRMLTDLALDISFAADDPAEADHRSYSGGLFLVPDARSATDILGRNIIPDQAFVETHGIRSVFGLGARYNYHARRYVVFICFCAAQIDRESALQYGPLLRLFTTMTAPLVAKGAYFKPPS